MRGCSEGAVRDAIRTGKIKEGVIKNEKGVNKFIITEIADKEWATNYREDRKGSSNYDLHDNLDKAAKGASTTPKKEKSGKPINPKLQPKDTDGFKAKIESMQEQSIGNNRPDDDEPEPAGEITMAEAKRREAIAKAQILELELAETQKKLISTELVKRAMFEFGEEVKNSLLAVPDRVIDDILASQTRNEAHILLKTAINEALTKLSTSKINSNEWAV